MSERERLIAKARKWATAVRGVGQIKQAEASHLESFGYDSLATHIDALATALEAADADAKRLDWLEANGRVWTRDDNDRTYLEGVRWSIETSSITLDLRSVIDRAARVAEEPPDDPMDALAFDDPDAPTLGEAIDRAENARDAMEDR